MGVRAKKRASPAHSELKRCTLISCVPLSRKADAGGLWSAEAKLPPMLKLTLQHSKQVSVQLTPLPQRGSGDGGEGKAVPAL